MAGRDIVVVGGSAGSIEVLTEFVGGLPPDFPGSIFVVVHFPGSVTSTLPRILSRSGPLTAQHPHDGESIEPGRIYVAPPDCHLHVSDGPLRLTRGPKENGHRYSASTFTEQAMDAEQHASVIRSVLHSGIRIENSAEVAAVGVG